jgi:hypothetical protein
MQMLSNFWLLTSEGRGRRHNFAALQGALVNLVAALKSYSAEEVLDMDNIMCRETVDIIGVPRLILMDAQLPISRVT